MVVIARGEEKEATMVEIFPDSPLPYPNPAPSLSCKTTLLHNTQNAPNS